jgi:ATP-dependent RNA helicase DeaD
MSKITFSSMPLSEGMKQTINEIGFTDPTPIQEQSIPELLQGRDLLGQAQTGTGKTGAFAIPLVEMVDSSKPIIQAMVVCPTRELCLQVCQEIKRLSPHKQIETVALYGGQAIDQQFRALKMGKPQIIVATPGRLFDHLRRKSVELSTVSMIVLDEADEMLDMGFRDEIEQIFDLLPEENQRIFFSATMPKAIKDLACNYLRDPKIIKIETKSLTASKIAQTYFKVRGKEKTELLCRVLDIANPKLAIVFCNAKSTVDEIVEDINSRGFEAGVLHGDLSQNQRDRVMAKFKSSQIRVLVATDVAARGIDIDDIEMVLNYHLPHDPEDYVHRIGRTGRAGRSGKAISLVEARDNSRLRRISQFAKVDIAEENPPTLLAVKSAKLGNLLKLVEQALSSEKIDEYRSFLAKQKLSAEDIAVGMLQLTLKKFDETAKNDDLFEDLRDRKYTSSRSRRPAFSERRDFERRDFGGRDRDRDRDSRRKSFREEDSRKVINRDKPWPKRESNGFERSGEKTERRTARPFNNRMDRSSDRPFDRPADRFSDAGKTGRPSERGSFRRENSKDSVKTDRFERPSSFKNSRDKRPKPVKASGHKKR